MPLFGNGVDQAAAELRKLREARGRLETDAMAAAEQHAALRTIHGDAELSALLDGGDSNQQIRREIADLETKLAGLAAARPKLLDRIRAAMKVHAHARAEAIRKDAAKIRAKYDDHQAETAKLLSALETHAGIRFEMGKHPVLPPGTLFTPNELPPLEPKSYAMEREMRALLQRADDIEQAASNTAAGGQATGSMLDGLLAAVSDNPLAPTRAEVEAWFATARARAEADWKRSYPGGPEPARETVFTLAWDADCRIDQSSGAVNHALSPYETGEAQRAEREYIAGHQLSGGRGAGAMLRG